MSQLQTSIFRRLPVLLACLALAVTAACRSYVFMPVEVTYGTLSPPYVIHFVNQTGAPFEILPSKQGAIAYPAVSVAPGGSFRALLQWRRLSVGAHSGIPGAQLVDNPYFEQAGANRAELRIRTPADTHSLFISGGHPDWFAEYSSEHPAPRELRVPLREFSRAPLFLRGPHAGP